MGACRTEGCGRSWATACPTGFCADAEDAIWYADVPNKRCTRVREGGEVLQTVELDRGCFACALGGPDGSTLFMVAHQWNGLARMLEGPSTGQVLTMPAPAPGAGRPWAHACCRHTRHTQKDVPQVAIDAWPTLGAGARPGRP